MWLSGRATAQNSPVRSWGVAQWQSSCLEFQGGVWAVAQRQHNCLGSPMRGWGAQRQKAGLACMRPRTGSLVNMLYMKILHTVKIHCTASYDCSGLYICPGCLTVFYHWVLVMLFSASSSSSPLLFPPPLPFSVFLLFWIQGLNMQPRMAATLCDASEC